MSLGLIGRKVGMTRLFTEEGDAVPVTVIDVSDNRIAQIKTEETDGYTSVQLAFGTRRASRVLKPQAGHYAKAGVLAIDPETGLANAAFGRMSGPLILARDPEPDDDALYGGLIAATKRYVDNAAFGSQTNLYVALSGEDSSWWCWK